MHPTQDQPQNHWHRPALEILPNDHSKGPRLFYNCNQGLIWSQRDSLVKSTWLLLNAELTNRAKSNKRACTQRHTLIPAIAKAVKMLIATAAAKLPGILNSKQS